MRKPIAVFAALVITACQVGERAPTTAPQEPAPPAPITQPTTSSTRDDTTDETTSTASTDVCGDFSMEEVTLRTSEVTVFTCEQFEDQSNIQLVDGDGDLLELPFPEGREALPMRGPYFGIPAIEGSVFELVQFDRGDRDCGTRGRWDVSHADPVLLEFSARSCAYEGGQLPDEWPTVYRNDGGPIDGPVPDGNGCTPSETLTDGLWYGYVTITDGGADLDLVCLYTGYHAGLIESTFIDWAVTNESDQLRSLPIGPNTSVSMWNSETFEPDVFDLAEGVEALCAPRGCGDTLTFFVPAEIEILEGLTLLIRELPSA